MHQFECGNTIQRNGYTWPYIYTLHIPYSQTKVVVLLILLVWWLDLPKCDAGPYQVLEYFAGVGRIAAIGKFTGLTSAALDISYGEHLGKRMGSERGPQWI